MFTLFILGTGLAVGIYRCSLYKKDNKATKVKYYNYSKYSIKHKKLNQSMSEQSKNLF